MTNCILPLPVGLDMIDVNGCLNGNMMYRLFVIAGYIYTSLRARVCTTTTSSFVYIYVTLFACTINPSFPPWVGGAPRGAHGLCESIVVIGNDVALAVGKRVDGVRQQVALVVDARQTLLMMHMVTRWFRK